MVTALLDSGGAESIVTERLTRKLPVKTAQGKPKMWTTPAGDVTTTKRVKSQFTMLELHKDRLMEWNFHVTKSLGTYDMILGRDLLEFLGLLVTWKFHSIKRSSCNSGMVNWDLTLLMVVTSPTGFVHTFGLPCAVFTGNFLVSLLVTILSVPPLSSSTVTVIAM